MKYIRTKDYGVCKIINEDKHALSYENRDVVGCLWKDSYKGKIQYADTIEELCDKCVVKLKHEEQPFVGSFYEFEHFINQYVKKIPSNNPVVGIFGAIWTEWGLKYVAKMNKKGELELL